MRALDLFCGAGGVSKGLASAGFDVWGVDIKPQPLYVRPERFVQADALDPPFDLADFDFVWASPPCQAHSVGSKRWDKDWPDLIPATRALLAGHPLTCIENVPGAPIRADLVLIGPMFGLTTLRRRHFELSFPVLGQGKPWRDGPKTTPGFCTVAGNGGDGPNRHAAWAEAMGIDWMDKAGLRQAIPPAYAEYIGRAAMGQLTARAAA